MMGINPDINIKRSTPFILMTALVWCLFVLWAPGSALAVVTATVTDPGDSATPTAGMLRQAVNDPNVDVIIFASGINLINLTAGALVIDRDLIIKGDLETVTIARSDSAPTEFRIFYISGQPGVPIDVHLENLIISGGYDPCCGAGLYAAFEDATITLDRCTVKNNLVDIAYGYGAGITVQAGLLMVTGSVVQDNTAGYGAGIMVDYAGVLTMDNCTISGNQAQGTSTGHGGGLYVSGTCSIAESTIKDNTAVNSGGGGYIDSSILSLSHSTISNNESLYGDGGGIYNAGYTVSMITCTVSGNRAGGSTGRGGGIQVNQSLADPSLPNLSDRIQTYDEMTIGFCTIADNYSANNGGGLNLNQGQILLYNTIVARNTAANEGPDCYTEPGLSITSQGYNLIQDNTGFDMNPVTGDIYDNPIMGLLADNGGPTKTHALFSPSPALEAGDPDVTGETDQRGVERPQGAVVDIGAYEASHYLVSLTKDGTGQGTVTSTPRGLPDAIDCPETCTSQTVKYAERTSNIVLTASPAAGSEFVSWSGDCEGSGHCNLEMNGDKNVTAIFQIVYELTTAVSPEGAGTVSGAGTYYKGSQAIVTAYPATGWVFNHWSGDYSGTENPIELTMDADKTVTANFIPVYVLQVTVDPEEAGMVDGGGRYPAGETARLTATANTGWIFDRWSGDVEGTDNPIDVLMGGHKSVIAHFIVAPAPTYTLTVNVDPEEGGTTTGAGTYPAGQTATVEAIPASGWDFHSWQGAINTTENPAELVMNGDKTVTARFVKEDGGYTISLTGGTEQSAFLIIPVGAWNKNPKPSTVFGIPTASYDETMMRIGRWNQNLGAYRELPAMDDSESALPGWGAWFLFRNDTELKISGAVPLLEDGPDGAKGIWFALKKGWNQVGNPFNYPIRAAGITLASGAGADFWYWDGGTYWIVDRESSIDGYWGGWIWVDQDDLVFFNSERVDPPEAFGNKGLIEPAADAQTPPSPPAGLSDSSSSSLSEGGGGGGCFMDSLGLDKDRK